MAPILIDNRGLIKLGMISLLTVLVVFSAGYFSGYQKATVFYTAANEIEVLDLPEHDTKDNTDVNAQLPKMTVAGEEIDVDQPVVIKPDLAKNKKSDTEEAVITKPETMTAGIPTKMVRVSSDDKIQLDVIKGSADKLLSKTSIEVIPDDTVKLKQERIEVLSLTADELSEIKYSAQVGMYGNLVNAENMAKILQAKNFNAYVVDYTNKKNEVRYNVRFGYFLDKKTAISALKRYKEDEKGDGYLVNFSVDNIVKLANKNTVEPVVPIEIIDKTESLDNSTTETSTGEVTKNETTKGESLSKTQSEELALN